MSLNTPTGNPYPYGPDSFFYSWPDNLAWIKREQKQGETDEQTVERMKRESFEWTQAHRS